MNPGRATILLIAVLASLPGLAGCASDPTQGYSANSLYSPDISSVAVDIFQNDTYERGVEFELADALVKEIESRTPYKVASQTHADSMLTGRIRSVKRDVLSRSPDTGLSEEVVLSVTIDFEWRDLRTEKSLAQRQSFAGQGLFLPSRPVAEPIELGQFAAVQQLARDIVEVMRAEW